MNNDTTSNTPENEKRVQIRATLNYLVQGVDVIQHKEGWVSWVE